MSEEILKPGQVVVRGRVVEPDCIMCELVPPDGWSCITIGMESPEFPDVLAALQALYDEQQKPEWVELGHNLRIRSDGTEPQYGYSGSDKWYPAGEGHYWPAAYRAGLEQGKS